VIGRTGLTLDVDCTLLTVFGQEARYVDELLASFTGRVDGPREFALANRVLLLRRDARAARHRAGRCPSRSGLSTAPPR
jgi:hypothetical protein